MVALLTAPARKMTVAELLAAHAASLTPSVGDKGYTRYHGRKWVGIITHIDENGRGFLEPENAKEDWGYHTGSAFWIGDDRNRKLRGLMFGYDEAVTFDPAEGMFYCPADAD